jgi:hypothetical protein
MKTPEERIEIIEQSMRCFVYGLLAFIPLAGIVPSIMAIAFYRRARVAVGKDWNPASTYLTWGLILAWFNLILDVIVLAVVIIVLAVIVFQDGGMFGSD